MHVNLTRYVTEWRNLDAKQRTLRAPACPPPARSLHSGDACSEELLLSRDVRFFHQGKSLSVIDFRCRLGKCG